ncbi:hypothetical protein BOTBODRAFT_205941 [Botryobasidium botryosum FD-172 SS1]|uniref:Uncharacterized protein n=1 Tax=Botryobasidium botryosum (strain FD-172 SS1) TaxID=930990 RepID=A0A067N3I3_BOTB1|nr:hypothetical protein BOTBODRAFT_205941 [Botryobasidium botryosum FD-172 SS1]
MAPITHPLANARADLSSLHSHSIDLSSLLPSPSTQSDSDLHNDTLVASYDFVLSARQALQIASEGEVEKQGEKVDSVRDTLESIVRALEARK